MSMELVFLGTGGGRFNLVRQVRKTAGFRIHGSLNIHVDPGPGALFECLRRGIAVGKTDVIIVTHNHIDHVNDANLLIEALAKYGKVAPVAVIGSKSAISGDSNGDRGVSHYHQTLVKTVSIASPGKPIRLGSGRKTALLSPTKVRHDDRTGFGFVLEIDGARIGYTSDTEYFRELPGQYANLDLLIANNLKGYDDGVPDHLYSGTTALLLAECRPKMCALQHMGLSLIKSGPEKEAKKIEAASGIRTIAAQDGMRLRFAGGKMQVLK